MRRVVEVELAALAAARATAGELSDIEKCLADQRVSTGTRREFLAKDLEFHNLIAKASHNSLFSVFLGSLRRLMSNKMQVLLLEPPDANVPVNMANTVDQHGEIVRALLARDPERSRERMRHHLEQVYTQWLTLQNPEKEVALAGNGDHFSPLRP